MSIVGRVQRDLEEDLAPQVLLVRQDYQEHQDLR